MCLIKTVKILLKSSFLVEIMYFMVVKLLSVFWLLKNVLSSYGDFCHWYLNDVSRLNWFIFISRKIFYNQFFGIPIKNKINRMSKSLIIAQVSDVFLTSFLYDIWMIAVVYRSHFGWLVTVLMNTLKSYSFYCL